MATAAIVPYKEDQAIARHEGRDQGEHDEPKYAIGVLAGLEWSPVPNAELSDTEKNHLKELCRKAAKRDYPARLVEVIQTWEAPLDVETPIPTPCGWKTMGSLQTGDYVFGSNGRIASVTHAHPIETQPSYVVLFSDGSSIIAGETHSWMTTTCKERSLGRAARERKTKELFETQDKQHAIQMMPGLETFDTRLPIDPYLLGCWLGDGIAASGEICGNEKDLTEIVGHIPGAVIRKKVSREYGTYCLATIPGFRAALYNMGLLKNKRIPEIYLRAAHEQRLALLQGLMDTDGSATSNGGCAWGQYKGHKGLVDGFSELLSSLGIKHQFYSYSRKRETREETFEFWQTTFHSDLPCFRLRRKVEKQHKPIGNRAKLLYITGVEEVGPRKVRCITVDTPDHLFLAGKSMVPTHNCLFYRGFQFLIPQRGGGWIIPGEATGYGPSMQMDLALLPTNIYSARAQMIISALTRTVPNARFAPQRANSAAGITAAESAEKFVKVISKNNDLIQIQTDASRYLWTDGRYHYWSRFVKDGQRFGWEEDDEPDDVLPETEPAQQPQGTPIESAAAAGTPESAETAIEEEATAGQAMLEGMNEEEDEEAEIPMLKRTPRGQEVRTAHGKLEVKVVPMMANEQCEYDVLQFEQEVDVSRAKGMFPWVADDIKSSTTQTSMGEIARLARQNVKLGLQSTYVTSDSIAHDVTIQRTWMRPSYLMTIEDQASRDKLIAMFPNGCFVTYAGETFCCARNESMDDSWSTGQAYSGDGQNRNAMGTSTLPIQKRLNNWLDLMNDIFVRTIPKKWMDSKVFAIDAIRQQTNVPGDIGSFKRQPGVPVAELVFVEPAVNPPANLADFIKEYSGPLAELLSGAYPALAGGDVGTADSGVAIATQRDSALGRLSPTWHSMKKCEAESMRQMVRWGAKCRDKSVNEQVPGGEIIALEVNDLKGNISVYIETDENFPETYTQKSNKLMGAFDNLGKNPQLAEVFFNAANLEFLQNMLGLSDLYIPQVASRNKQLAEIEILLKSTPVPNPALEGVAEKIQMMEAQGVDPMELEEVKQQIQQMPKENSSIQINSFDDDATEAATCWQYMSGPEGRAAQKNNALGFQNVELHFNAHNTAAQQKAAAAAQNAQPGKPPSVSVGYKDVVQVDTGAAQQILQKAGISPSPGAGAPSPVPPTGAGAKATKPPAAPIPAGTPQGAGGIPKH